MSKLQKRASILLQNWTAGSAPQSFSPFKKKVGNSKIEEMKHTQSDQLQGQLSRALIAVAKSDIFQMRGMVCAGTNQLSSSNSILLSTSGGT